MSCQAVPYESSVHNPGDIQDPKWKIQVGRVLLQPAGPCLKGKSSAEYVVVQIKKDPMEYLMTPNAHFYGPMVYAYVVWQKTALTKKQVAPVFMRIKDVPVRPTLFRHLSIVLCQPNGHELPELSTQLYPSRQPVHCAVNRATFQSVRPEDMVCFIPDPERVDIQGTPKAEWIYSLEPLTKNHPHAVDLHVQSVSRHYLFPSGRKAPYVVHGFTMAAKIIQPALYRDVGRHVAPLITTEQVQHQGINRQRFHVRTDKVLLLNEDFKIHESAIRIIQKTATGYYGYLLCENKK